MVKVNQVSVIIPTMKRHKQLKALLQSLYSQTKIVGEVFVADGGKDAEIIVNKFKKKLPITYLNCPTFGQIAQRNYALKFVKKDINLVAYLDDDLQLERKAFESIIEFYNSRKNKPAGVSFNITNMPHQPNSLFRKFFLMPLTPSGKVFKSGYNAPITNLNKTIKVEWLLGGATLWRKDVLENNPLPPVNLSWAVCEDLIFSYPISKIETLYVCHNAKTLHVDNVIKLKFKTALQKAKIGTFRRFEFVQKNKDLSILLFFWMCIGQIIGRSILICKNPKVEFGNLLGIIFGIFICIKKMILKNE